MNNRRWWRYPEDFRRMAVERFKCCENIELLAKEHSVPRQTLGSGFFQRRLAENRGSTPREQRIWRAGIYDHIRDVMSLQGGFTIERMCLLIGVSRAGFYRHLLDHDPCDEEMAVRSEIQKIILEHQQRYGYRRVAAELRRRGKLINQKRVARMMREDSLVGTDSQLPEPPTDGTASVEIYVNLANRCLSGRSKRKSRLRGVT